jgi:hypothetical protein
MKDFFRKFLQGRTQGEAINQKKEPISRQELEVKAIEGVHKGLKEYRRVFERLAEYDRA